MDKTKNSITVCKTLLKNLDFYEVLILQHFYYWINFNKENHHTNVYIQDKWWTFLSRKQIINYFDGIITERKFRTVIGNLIKKNIIEVQLFHKEIYNPDGQNKISANYYTIIDRKTYSILENFRNNIKDD